MACGHCGAGPRADPRVKDLFRALLLRAREHEEELGRDVLGRGWDFGQADRGNFTLFGEGVEEVLVSAEKALCFTTEAEKVVLGWGNYAGGQPVTARVWIPWGYTLVMKVRQSTEDVSTWGVRFWADGESVVKANAALLHGTKPQMMEFSLGRMPYTHQDYQLTVPDGFELEIEGPDRNEIEILSLGFYRRVHEGCFRRTFDLGDKTVWRAMASVSKWGRLYVNGQEVETENSVAPPPESVNGAHYNPVPIDLASYLKPGRNCVAIYRKSAGYPPFLYLQGRIIFTNGESISLDTDRSWRGAPRPEDGWTAPDFDDSAWRPAKLGRPGGYYTYMQRALPAYDGRLVIESPDDSMLFFDAAEPVNMRVRTPVGLRAEQPSLEWALQAADLDGEQERAGGTIDRYRTTEDSLVYEIDCGRLHAQPNGDFAREAFTQALAASDPEQVLFGFVDVNLMVGNEQPLREFARVLRTLPRQQLKPALGTSLKTNLAIRGLRAADGYYFTVANPGTWPIQGAVEVEGATVVVELASGREVASARPRGSVQVQVSLPPFGVSAFRADSAEAKLVSWQTKPVAAEHLSHMRSLVQRAQAGLNEAPLAGVLLPDEVEFLRASTATARQALAEGKYALAWSTVTHWRFWTLLKLLEKGTPSEPVAAERHLIYEAKPGRIVLWGSDEAAPFRPSDLLAADRREGWGVVRYDAKTDTTRVNATLVIGRTDGTSTYFQIGSADHPRETLVLKGDLQVAPPKPSGTRRDGRPFTVNRLQLGQRDQPEIKATLKFDCSPPDKFGIQLGVKVERDGRATWRAGGSLRVYHSTITALEQDWLHAFAASSLMGSEVRLVNSTVSWCGGLFAYGLSGVKRRRIEGTTFEHCAQVLYNGHQRATDCVFRHCGIVAAEGGCLSGTFERCTFRDNGANFTKSRPGEIQFIDCDVGPQRQPLRLRSGEDGVTGQLGYPSVADVRTLIVSVVDDDGRPIPGAAVDLVCEQPDETAVLRGFAIAGRDGQTPGARDRDRLLFTERRLRAARSPAGHEEIRYTYSISVLASGFERTELSDVRPLSGISRLRLVLQRQK